MILVTGATGNVGSKVVQQLSASGQHVWALVRSLEKLTYINSPVDVYKKALLDSGIPEWHADAMIALFSLYSTNFASKVTNAVLEVAKQPPRTFEQFARDYVRAFKR